MALVMAINDIGRGVGGGAREAVDYGAGMKLGMRLGIGLDMGCRTGTGDVASMLLRTRLKLEVERLYGWI